MLKYLLVFLICVSLIPTLSGQCPDKVALWNRIVFLRDSTNVADSIQLKELSGYLEKIKVCPPLNDSTDALLLIRIGALHSGKKDFKTAIAFTLRSISMIHSHIGEPGNAESQLVKAYHNLSNYYDSTEQIHLAKRASDSCIYISLRLNKMYEISAQHISSKINELFGKGDYYHCLEIATIGEEISRKSGYRSDDVFYYACWEINSYIFLNRFPEASQKLKKSIAACIQSEKKSNLGSLLNLKATVAVKNGSPEEAIRFTMESFNYEKRNHNYPNCASALSNLGYDLYYKRLHQNKKALYYFKEALLYANSNDSLSILNNMANVYVQMGDFKPAFDYFQQAFNKIHPLADERFLINNFTKDFFDAWNAEYLFNLVLDKAEAFLIKYNQTNNPTDLKSALSIYKAADHLMDKIKIAQTNVSSKLFWRSNTRRLYENAIKSCYLADNMEDAFYFFEKSRAVLLNDQLKEQETNDPNLIETALLQKKLLDLEMPGNKPDPFSNEYSGIQREIFITREQLSHLDQLIKENNSWYYQSLIDTNFITLKEVQNQLLRNNNTQAILEFFNGDSACYLLSVTPAKSSITRINKTKFDNQVARYTTYLSNPDLENQDFKGFVMAGKELYDLIFNEFHLPKGRIIISPDGGYFPFEALITNPDISAPSYFLNDYAVSYTYSVRFLLNDFKKNKTFSTGNFLGIAPVHYPEYLQLSSLPLSDVSVGKIGSNFSKTYSLIATQATRNNFMEWFHKYKMIQLYTHASDTSANGEPVIYFADSALYLSELIPENKTAAQLIVLSACETGNGTLYKGEGVFSFNRGFAALGIPSSVTNLWAVDNESTYRITELFYKYVSEGLPLDISLQKAKLDFISASSKEKRLPYYWAAAIVVGRTDPVELSPAYPWKLLLVMTGSLAGILLLMILLRKNNRPLRLSHAAIL